MQGISRAIDRALDNAISPWKLCRPAGNFKVWSIERRRDSYATETVPRCKIGSCSIHDWRLSDDYSLELASVPIITGQDAFRTGLSVGSPDVLKRLFEDMEIPISVLSSFLNNRIQFTIFPSQKAGKAVHLLNFRQWAIAWNCDAAKGSSKAILLWMGGSWAKLGIERHVKPFLGDIAETRINHHSPGLLGVLLCARNVAESLADLDEEAFRTERRLRQLIQDGQLKQEDELGRLSAAHGWLFARSIRERSRLSAASSFLEYATSHRPSLDPNRAPASRAADLEALQLLTKSLLAQAAKLGEESNMHLSTIYNLIAQRDQATNLAIAAASREIALQSKVDQENSLEIAQASKKIAEESRKDSNAMKMIAIVTMVYLPGTFVATCFSMGIFQWTARASDVVSPRIWVYFLFTAVLTILTIGGFVGWTWWQDRYFPQDNVEALSLRHSAKFDSPGSRPAAPKETIRTNTRTASMVQSALIEPPKKSPLINVASVDAEKSDGVQSVSQPAGTTQPPPLLGPLTLGGVPRSVSPFQNMNRRSELPRRHLRQRSVSIRSISPPDTTLVKYNGPPFTTSALARHALRSQTRSRSRSRSRSRTRSFDRDFRLQMRHGQSRSSSSDSLPDKRYTARARSRERAQPHGDRAYPYRSRSRSVDRGYRYENRNRSRSRSRTRLGSIIFFPDESTAEHKTHDSNAVCPESVITTIRQSHNVVELDTSSQPEPEPEPEPGLSSDSYLDIRLLGGTRYTFAALLRDRKTLFL
ncbi:hypothetical protein PMZ80_006949 [Knufia obscura]|uniref:Uncharacterized protein n=2 Tax=Knufia TaxID=430999 RepID=A0AAN8ERV2_9EURO|nr:hypothetical protein PMZ80_006949 [Knufia obscura]KAK5957488.1 hypothetical protein OHC33_001863 [Knufia fluminis]